MSESVALKQLRRLLSEDQPLQEAQPLGELQAAREKIAQLEVAVEHRGVISQAVGILMERYHLDDKTAFAALARVSQETNRKVYDIAQELSATGRSDGLDPDG